MAAVLPCAAYSQVLHISVFEADHLQMSSCHNRPEGLPMRGSKARQSWEESIGSWGLQSVHDSSKLQVGHVWAKQHLGSGSELHHVGAECEAATVVVRCLCWSSGVPSQASHFLRMWLHRGFDIVGTSLDSVPGPARC